MAVVIDEAGAGHEVMLLRMVIATLSSIKKNVVLVWDQTGYTDIKVESDEGSAWALLGGVVTAPPTPANR